MSRIQFLVAVLVAAAFMATLVSAMPLPESFATPPKRCRHISKLVADPQAAALAAQRAAIAVQQNAAASQKAAAASLASVAAAQASTASEAAAAAIASQMQAAGLATTKAPQHQATPTTSSASASTTTTTKSNHHKSTTTSEPTTTTTATTHKPTTTTTTTTTTTSTTSEAAQETGSSISLGLGIDLKFSGDGTWYTPGLGSCGITNSASDLIGAMNYIQMDNGANPNANPNCGRYVLIKGPNGTVKVKITDTCPTCAYGSIDLSPAAFEKIANLDTGRVTIHWTWVD